MPRGTGWGEDNDAYGAALLFYEPPSGVVLDEDADAVLHDTTASLSDRPTWVGGDFAAAPDLTGDGYADLVVGGMVRTPIYVLCGGPE